MSDIVERLWKAGETEAADEIERLRDIIEEHEHSSTVADIRAATIEECAKWADYYGSVKAAEAIRALKEKSL